MPLSRFRHGSCCQLLADATVCLCSCLRLRPIGAFCRLQYRATGLFELRRARKIHNMSQAEHTLLDADYVLTLEEIGNLAEESGKPAETLMNVVALIARRFQTDVCSAYLLEPDRANLVLAATLGLRPQCIGTLRMPIHEGLSGLVAEEVRPVAVEQVKTHPRFKYFREAGEDAYQSFLGVPLIDQGVLQACSSCKPSRHGSFEKMRCGCWRRPPRRLHRL